MILFVALLFAQVAAPRELTIDLEGGAYSVVAADFTGDGRVDLAVTGADRIGDVGLGYFLALYESTGDGFRLRSRVATDPPIDSLAAGDVDGDGFPDLVTPMKVWIDPGVRGFADGRDLPFDQTLRVPYAVATADFNQDGRDDVAVADLEGRAVMLFSYTDRLTLVGSFQVPHYPNAICTGDFNGDGLPDLATVASKGSVATLLAEGEFRFGVEHSPSIGSFFSAVTAADFDGDGRAELAVADMTRKSAFVFIDRTEELPVSDFVVSVAAGDVTGDGVPDVLIGQLNGAIDIFEYAPGVGFKRPFEIRRAGDAFQITVRDLDGDGFSDIVIADPTRRHLRVLYGPIPVPTSVRRRAVRR